MDKIEKYQRELDVANKQISKWTEKKKTAGAKLKTAKMEAAYAEMEAVHAEMEAKNLSWEDTLEILRNHGASKLQDKLPIKEG